MTPAPGHHAGQRPGRMTAVMTAMPAPTGPRVLRIGLVRAGRIIEERIVSGADAVTVGPSEKNTFVVLGDGLPASFRLFDRAGGELRLHLRDGMTGRVALPAGVSDLVTLAAQASMVTLSDDARGRVTLGDTTLLFQLEAPRPVASRAQLPASVMGHVGNEIDWTMTIIAAFSFLIHFGAAGSIYSNWADRIVSDEAMLTGSALVVLTTPPRPPPTEQPREIDETAPSTPSNDKAPTNHVARKPTNDSGRTSDGHSGPRSDAAAIAQSINAMQTAILATMGSGPAARSVLTDQPLPGSLTSFATADAAVRPGSDLRMHAASTGPVGPGQRADLGSALAGRATDGNSGQVQGTTGPNVGPRTGPNPLANPNRINGADRVITLARSKARACYQQGLGTNPDMDGRASFTISVSGSGGVSSASVSPSGSLSPAVVSCIRSVLSGLIFEAPENGSATLTGSFSFVNANKKP